jgi:hypothetical protein
MVVRYTRSVRFEESLRVLIALSESKPLYNSINVLIPLLLLVPQKRITPTWLYQCQISSLEPLCIAIPTSVLVFSTQ